MSNKTDKKNLYERLTYAVSNAALNKLTHAFHKGKGEELAQLSSATAKFMSIAPKDLSQKAMDSLFSDFAQAKQNARHDALTGLLNRRTFDEDMQTIFEHREQRNALPVKNLNQRIEHEATLLIVDLNSFKAVNDQYGHDVGDAVLAKVGETLLEHKRPFDKIYRYGGEEFALLLEDLSPDDVNGVIQRYQDTIRNASITLDNGQLLSCSASIGVSYMEDTDTPSKFFKRADKMSEQQKPKDRGDPKHLIIKDPPARTPNHSPS